MPSVLERFLGYMFKFNKEKTLKLSIVIIVRGRVEIFLSLKILLFCHQDSFGMISGFLRFFKLPKKWGLKGSLLFKKIIKIVQHSFFLI